ncbi:MAG TPA: hypothetical protein VGL44_08765 [Gaiellales bacterium]|jgi:hypothetical protein
MPTHTLARGVALAGLAAASATAAHGGGAAVSNPAWAVPALVAAAIGVAALTRLTAAAEHARAAAARPLAGASAAVPVPLGLPATVAIMLCAQGCAHVALIAAGAPAHSGQLGALALHTGLAVLGAAAVWAADRALGAALRDLGAAIVAAVELLLAGPRTGRTAAPALPGSRPHRRTRLGRAPPATA